MDLNFLAMQKKQRHINEAITMKTETAMMGITNGSIANIILYTLNWCYSVEFTISTVSWHWGFCVFFFFLCKWEILETHWTAALSPQTGDPRKHTCTLGERRSPGSTTGQKYSRGCHEKYGEGEEKYPVDARIIHDYDTDWISGAQRLNKSEKLKPPDWQSKKCQ